jgi:hypothetical protein
MEHAVAIRAHSGEVLGAVTPTFHELAQRNDVMRLGKATTKRAIQLLEVDSTYAACVPISDFCLVRQPYRAFSNEMLSVARVSFKGGSQPSCGIQLKLIRDSKCNSFKENGRALNKT